MVKIAKNYTILESSELDSFLYGSNTDLTKVHSELIKIMPVTAVICGVIKPIIMPKRRRKNARTSYNHPATRSQY